MIQKFLMKRELKKFLKGINYELVADLLAKNLAGGVYENKLVKLVENFVNKPNLDTARELLMDYPDFVSFFEMAKSPLLNKYLE